MRIRYVAVATAVAALASACGSEDNGGVLPFPDSATTSTTSSTLPTVTTSTVVTDLPVQPPG